ncbi:MAG: DUF3391 domain-containing protein [Gammaproteobacteria bacterium]|jgi:HD-GYP domain-containing protein (c-di-GMP phosphodiesterase class II)|nr:DUF3391 domain-containing protein [Gammaproteobacteria bacterium]MBT3860566.1 DUF3391 domain-containing protein [Gammaproteobacteria bacterium]MBT3987308.1 DUF3391 domain-containing protein [Gammaproteobacteria bacterium]MBT4256523.1 DUF3391 domain-containing protein [Gammaproteobacteria bacterium]MBT4581272.1 DUF3391 domain-containing protein [Gammaproteobacteria bacterium]
MSREHTDNTPYSSDHLIDLDSNELLKGMFVADIDCAWSKTPFEMGGFHIRSSEDIQILQKYCSVVVIDLNKGVKPRKERLNDLTILSSARQAVPASASLKINRETHAVTHTIKQQIDKAHLLYESLTKILNIIAHQTRLGDSPDFTDLSRTLEALTDCIVANPQTLIWILNTDSIESSATVYCARSGVWAAILARQTGMSKNDIQALFMGTVLADIGMHLLPERLVTKTGPFRKKEFLAYKKHVDFGLELLAQHSDLDDRIVSIVRCHHERHDGLGFPRGLRGEQVPLLARYASLAYSFERLLRKQSKAPTVSPVKAMARLYKQRVLKFPEQLAVEFIHVMGTYPIGSLVELSSGEVAIVLQQIEGEKLAPRVAVLSNNEKKKLKQAKEIELSSSKYRDAGLTIKGSLGGTESHKLNINASDYMMEFCGKRVGFGALSVRV